ncbi:MAG: hypothetical protein U5O39_19205 [Gammaproteobacteria bacterium]|nr:hypothetical protein [Gammaproteobacteria bacterium]
MIRFSRQYIGFAVDRRNGSIPQEIGERVALLQQTFPGKLVTLEKLLPLAGREVAKDRLLEVAADAEQAIRTMRRAAVWRSSICWWRGSILVARQREPRDRVSTVID